MTENKTSSRLWRWARRLLIVVVALVTVVALFYAEEDWRGKRAWGKEKQKLEARGIDMNWAKLIPPPVPDDQNIFKAPKMAEWFVGRGGNDLTRRLGIGSGATNVTDPEGVIRHLLVAQVTLVLPGVAIPQSGVELSANDARSLEVAEKLMRDNIGPAIVGASGRSLLVKAPSEVKPVRFFAHVDSLTATNEVGRLLPVLVSLPAPGYAVAGRVKLEAVTNGVMDLRLEAGGNDFCSADAYLAWSERFETDFDIIREALKRPYSRIEGDYTQSFSMPIPNFVALRSVAQVLSQRVVCRLLLGQPDQAMPDLTLLHDLSRLTQSAPTGKPMTLVAAMINVAITGLYADTIGHGFRLHAWREPQIVQIQAQLAEINLPPQVSESMRTERVGFNNMLETGSPTAMANVTAGFRGAPKDRWSWYREPMSRFMVLVPRGWLYQNMIHHAEWSVVWNESADMSDGQIHPRKLESTSQNLTRQIGNVTPYSHLAAMAIPNLWRAMETLACNQTRVYEALIACALERYHLANGEYPETTAALVPNYLDKVPADLIGGQPLKYRRTPEGSFLLYSLGWVEKDEGGAPALPTSQQLQTDTSKGNWVWLPTWTSGAAAAGQ